MKMSWDVEGKKEGERGRLFLEVAISSIQEAHQHSPTQMYIAQHSLSPADDGVNLNSMIVLSR